MPAIHLLVQGRVQGVGFRHFVRERAVSLGVAGWVRNTTAGDVEIAASGEAGQIEAFTRVVGQGPNDSLVEKVQQMSAPKGTEYPSPFRIL